MGQKIFSISPSQRDLWDKAEQQGYVYIKTDSGVVVQDSVRPWQIITEWYKVYLTKNTYGTEWAFTKEELK